MEFIILSFRSRNQTARMYEIFTQSGIPAKIVNTPREANVGCGISLKFDEMYMQQARQLANRYPQSTYIGFFKVSGNGRVFSIKRIG